MLETALLADRLVALGLRLRLTFALTAPTTTAAPAPSFAARAATSAAAGFPTFAHWDYLDHAQESVAGRTGVNRGSQRAVGCERACDRSRVERGGN